MLTSDSLSARIREYRNTGEHNEQLYREFTRLTDAVPWLKHHRDIIEKNEWGFGDRAFHYMWFLLLKHISEAWPQFRCLEIGVFKGQVISLWAKIAQELHLSPSITGISPLKGNDPSMLLLRALKRAKRLIWPKKWRDTSVYKNEDYLKMIQTTFDSFGLNPGAVRLIRGYSWDPRVIRKTRRERFHLLYIDGSHFFPAVCLDIRLYASKIVPGGYLVMDDAAFFLPGEGYFKGYEKISQACERLAPLGFVNVLNVGHNRVYQRSPKGQGG